MGRLKRHKWLYHFGTDDWSTDTSDDFLTITVEEVGFSCKMNIVAGASELVSIHRLDAVEWVKRNTKEGEEMYARNFSLREHHEQVLDFVQTLRNDGWELHIKQYDGTVALCTFTCEHKWPFLIIINRSHTDMWIYAYSQAKWVIDDFKERYGKNEKRLKLNWWYPSGSSFEEREIDFFHNIEVHDEFYPFVPGGLRSYFAEYMASEAPVLLLIGEPGTGKTSFIRHLINEHRLETVVSYDEKVMASDDFYCSFLTSEDKQLMVIEDADLLLRKRSDDKNPVMTKLLNISNGVVQLGNKKMVFSTNLDNLNDVDEALVRPGRCFDILDFRRLTPEEAVAASAAASLPPLEEPYKKDYTLAEIFNRKKMTYRSHKMGFYR
jgi:hypothetical protein